MKHPDRIPDIPGAASILHYAGTYIPASHNWKSHIADIRMSQESLPYPHTSGTLCLHPEDQALSAQTKFPLQ